MAEETGLRCVLSETSKTGFLTSSPYDLDTILILLYSASKAIYDSDSY